MKRLAFGILVVFVFSIPLENSFVFSGAGTISRAVGIVALFVGIISLFLPRRLEVRPPSLFLAVMSLFVFWSLLSYFWSINPGATLGRAQTFAQLLAMVWLIWQLCRTAGAQHVLLQTYILGALVSTSTSLINFIAGNAQESYNRFSATGFDPNNFATALALGIPIAWFLTSVYRHRLLFWLNLLYIPWAIFVIVLSASRGGFLIMAFALSIIPLTYGKLSLWRKLSFLAMLALGTYILLNLGSDLQARLLPNLERLSTTTTELTEGTLNSRTRIWAAGLEAFMHSPNPLIGSGSGTFEYTVEPLLDRARAPHNAYLSVLVDTGFIGLALFLALFVIALIPIFSTSQRTFYIILALALLLALTPLSWDTNKLTWFILALFTTRKAFVLGSVKGSLERAWS